MEAEGDGAGGALGHVATVAALHEAGAAAAIEEEDGLLALVEGLVEAELQGAAEHAAVARLELVAHVDHVDGRQDGRGHDAQGVAVGVSHGAHALLELEQGVLAPERLLVGDDVRRGRAHDQHGARKLGQLLGDVAGVVARRRVLLLVGPLVLLVDDDEAEVRLRREDGRPAADDDGVAAVADAVPLVEELALREAAVEHGDLAGEALGEAAHGLRREGDLRHEDDGALAGGDGVVEGGEVDLGLAGAGDAVQEEGLGLRRCSSPSRWR